MVVFKATQSFEFTHAHGGRSAYLAGQSYRVNESNHAMLEQIGRWFRQGRVEILGHVLGEHRPLELRIVNTGED